MQLAIGIEDYEIPSDLADHIIQTSKALDDSQWTKSVLGHTDSGESIRTSSGVNIDQILPDLVKPIRGHVDAALQHYKSKYGISITQNEGLDLLRYGVTEKYDFHYDGDWEYYRTVSMLIYLNPSEYSGGETEFKYFDLKVKPSKPSIVIFPSNYSYLHAALPVTDGEKFIIVSWMNDLPIGMDPGIMYTINKSVNVKLS